jgi:hypothetical protein
MPVQSNHAELLGARRGLALALVHMDLHRRLIVVRVEISD